MDRNEKVTCLERVTFPGQKSTILLSDGSKVQLYSGSKLVYPERFAENSRELQLEGEAFFEVVRDTKRPFKIKSGKVVTTVLGTSFNIKAYPQDQKIEVAVATGKVSVMGSEDTSGRSHLLIANSLATYDLSSDIINVESVDIQNLIAWKEGILTFNDTRFEEVAKTLENWYGVKITFDGPVGDCVIFGEFQNQSLSSVMKVLAQAIDIEYEFTEQGIIITKGGCTK